MNDKNIEKSGAMEAPAAPARAHNAGDTHPIGRLYGPPLAAQIRRARLWGLRHIFRRGQERRPRAERAGRCEAAVRREGVLVSAGEAAFGGGAAGVRAHQALMK